MDDAFVRDELFLPFRSTKAGGYGIGAFQTRELIRMSGGDLEVISERGCWYHHADSPTPCLREGAGGAFRRDVTRCYLLPDHC